MGQEILAFKVGPFIGGFSFSEVEKIEPYDPDSLFDAKDLFEDSESASLDLWDVFFNSRRPPGSVTLIHNQAGMVLHVDEVLDVLNISGNSIYPIPPYVFDTPKPFRGLFPYKDTWGVLIDCKTLLDNS